MSREEAYEKLRIAIHEIMTAEGYDEAVMIVDYVVCVAQQRFDDDGDTVTAYDYILPPGQIPHYRVMGLLKTIELEMTRQLTQRDI